MVNVAISIKRPSPSSSTTPTAKRARSSIPSSASSAHQDDDDNGDDMDDVAPLNETLLERKARKDARTIRNRESAQRSRNQRKAHLAWLEVRVVELEEENRRLRSESEPKHTPSASPTLVPSPSYQSALPLDLLLPPPTYPDTSSGINLASVAPPPTGIIPASLSTAEVDQLRAENAALRARLDLFDGLAKQVQAASSIVSTEPTPIPTTPLDWNSIFNTEQPSYPDPTPYIRQSSPTLYSSPSTFTTIDSTQQSSPIPLACHPAAVATPSMQVERSLQRARTDSGLISGLLKVTKVEWTEKRLDGVARVLVAMARIRGWIPLQSARWAGRDRCQRRKVTRRAGMRG